MATITEDYVSFETAKLLKEKGFNPLECGMYYSITTGKRTTELLTSLIACPTLQMTMKWLREFHGLNIYARGVWKDVEVQYGGWEAAVVGYEWFVESLTDDTYSKMSKEQFLTYEEACEAAIRYCLKFLI